MCYLRVAEIARAEIGCCQELWARHVDTIFHDTDFIQGTLNLESKMRKHFGQLPRKSTTRTDLQAHALVTIHLQHPSQMKDKTLHRQQGNFLLGFPNLIQGQCAPSNQHLDMDHCQADSSNQRIARFVCSKTDNHGRLRDDQKQGYERSHVDASVRPTTYCVSHSYCRWHDDVTEKRDAAFHVFIASECSRE